MWARIEGDRVAEITGIDPAGRYHPSLEWVTCDEVVRPGDIYEDGEFSKPAPPAPTAEEIRATRDAKLTATSWIIERHREEQETGTTTLTAQEYADLLAYRQALRDVPQQAGFPGDIDWPVYQS